MRIAMVSSDYLPNIGGIASHIFHLSRALVNKGYEITVVHSLPSDKKNISIYVDGGINVCKVYFKPHQNKYINLLTRTKMIHYALKHLEKIHGPYTIFHQHDHIDSTLAAKINAKRMIWIWTNHTSGFLKQIEHPIKRRIIKHLYNGVHGIIGVSRERAEKAKWVIGNTFPIEYIPNGVDLDLFKPTSISYRNKYNIQEDRFVVLCPSRMHPVKGIIYLARAINEILFRYNLNIQFIFVGDDPAVNTNRQYIYEVKQVLEEATNKGYVKFFGNIPQTEMPEIYSIADIVVLPSLQEAVSLSALESMASYKPVVATNVGGLPEIIINGKTGLLVEPRNIQQLIDAISTLYKDRSLCTYIAENAKKMVLKYSWEAVAEATIQFYNKIKSLGEKQ